MGKQKQQVISRFFAPKPKTPSSGQSSQSQSTSLNNPPTPLPKISATVTFSPSKRLRNSQLTTPNNKPSKCPNLSLTDENPEPSLPNSSLLEFSPTKKPKLSPHTHNPIPPLPKHTLHQRFINKLLEPAQELLEACSTSRTQVLNPKYTPLEQQVVELKVQYPNVLLMVEVGYRYRFFGDDAENAARVLGIYAHMDHNFLTASVPTFRFNVHVRRLVGAGYKVGVVKQTETAAIKAHGANRLAPFCRGLSALYTKATLEAAEDVGGGQDGCGSCSNYLLCVVEKGILAETVDSQTEDGTDVRIGVVGVEVSTGDVVYGDFSENFMRTGLEATILSLSPAELLLVKPLSRITEKLLLAYAGPASNVRVEHVSQDCFSGGGALADVMSFFEDMNEGNLEDDQQDIQGREWGNKCLAVEGVMKMPDLAIQALALIIRHLKQFGLERILCSGTLFRPFATNMEMTLSANALQQLEVLKNNSDGSESGSLLQCMNYTLTIFGSRLLRHWIIHPLCDRNMICARLDAVSEIAESMSSCKAYVDPDMEDHHVTIVQPHIYQLISSVLTTLGRSPDIQRGITRIFHRTATVSEFIAVIQAILAAGKQLQQFCLEEEDKEKDVKMTAVKSALLRKLILTASSSCIITIAAKLLSSLNKEASDRHHLHDLFIMSDGKFPEVAKAKRTVELAKEKLDLLIVLYRKQLKKNNLEFMSVSGTTHLIELSLDVKVPSNWVKVNSTKKTIRYHPPEVLTSLDQLSLAEEELTLVCRAAWDNFLQTFHRYYAEFQAAIQALAALDCLYSLAILSRNKNYVRPVFANNNEPVQIHICSGRHPVLDTVLQDNFVPNDTNLHAYGEYCQIVTGPNMGGKSCYIRQVALIAIMAQVGSFVPASSAKLHVLDGIHTRMGASDSIQQGKSTFLEELSEASNILLNCTGSSLVIIDELGRGTSTHDGVAIAYATLQYLLEKKKSMVLYVTHYLKVVDIKNEFPGSVGAYHVSYLTSQRETHFSSNSDEKINNTYHEDVTYLYKLVPGVVERSFGFKVAQMAQLPASCICRAIFMASRLEVAISNRKKNRLALRCSEELPVGKADTMEGNGSLPLDYPLTGGIEGVEDYIRDFKELFSILNSATMGDNNDSSKCFQLLINAKTLAMALINRFR